VNDETPASSRGRARAGVQTKIKRRPDVCLDCWDAHDSPAIDTPAVRAAARRIADVYEHSCVGGHLHIVIDDWNLEDDDLAYCEGSIRENVHGDPPEQLAAERSALAALHGLSEAERASALALHDGFWTPREAAHDHARD
jgi:hypothetical protein